MADKIVRDLKQEINERKENSKDLERVERISQEIKQLMVFNRYIN